MVSKEGFTATAFQQETQARVEALDALLPSDAFTHSVRQSLYRYALIRNSWGTTNIDAGPIDISRVEELYETWRRGVTGTGRILPNEREVLNYFRLIDDLPTQPFEVSIDDVRGLHQDYFRDVPLQNRAEPGRWKTSDNTVATPWRVLRTTPKERVEEALQSLLDWYNHASDHLPLVTRVAIFFHAFQRIHPFGDGNGRVGRLATLFLLGSGGLEAVRYCPVDDAINEDREEYYRALAEADEGDLNAWVNYFGAQIRSGYSRAHLLARRLQAIPPRVPTESQRLLEWVYVHRVGTFRHGDVKDFYLGESQRTRIRRLKELEDLGFLKREGTGAGSRYAVVPLHEIEASAPRRA
jgi:Fic family protein